MLAFLGRKAREDDTHAAVFVHLDEASDFGRPPGLKLRATP